MDDQSHEIECVIPEHEFELLREDKQFISVIQLARFENQLTFCLSAVPDISDPNRASYRESRQLINALLYGSSVLFEGLGQLREAMAQFKYYASYKNDFRPFMRSKNTHRLRERYLERFRNTVVSHVDRSVIAETLKWVSYTEYVFVAGSSASATIYYPMSDNIGFTATMGTHESNAAELQTIKDYLQTWREVSVDFSKVVNKVLLEYVEKRGWTFRKRRFDNSAS
jgi:hypothetical protein